MPYNSTDSLIFFPSSSFGHLLKLLEPGSLELLDCYSPSLGSVCDEVQFQLIDPFFRCTILSALH